MADVIDRTAFEEMLMSLPGGFSSVGFRRGKFTVSGYADEDMLRSKHLYATGATVAEAVENYRIDFEAAQVEAKKLTAAAECKAAVIDLIREHDAAPASFRDAVDALQVSDR